MDFREIVDSIAQACEWQVDEAEGSICIVVTTGADRSQMVLITEDVDVAEQAIVRYWSVIGPAKGIDFKRCLEENAKLAYGAFAIQDDQLVLMDTQLVQDVECDGRALAKGAVDHDVTGTIPQRRGDCAI